MEEAKGIKLWISANFAQLSIFYTIKIQPFHKKDIKFYKPNRHEGGLKK